MLGLGLSWALLGGVVGALLQLVVLAVFGGEFSFAELARNAGVAGTLFFLPGVGLGLWLTSPSRSDKTRRLSIPRFVGAGALVGLVIPVTEALIRGRLTRLVEPTGLAECATFAAIGFVLALATLVLYRSEDSDAPPILHSGDSILSWESHRPKSGAVENRL
jgi:predicted membrane protein